MHITSVTDRFSVSRQPERSDFAALAGKGFRLVVNNRPDGEDASQLGSAAEALSAEQAGMGYVFIPVTLKALAEADVRRFQAALAGANGPVFAHCKTGTRSLTLWTIGEVLDGTMSPGEIVGFGERHGYDLTAARDWIEQHQTVHREARTSSP